MVWILTDGPNVEPDQILMMHGTIYDRNEHHLANHLLGFAVPFEIQSNQEHVTLCLWPCWRPFPTHFLCKTT
jgi:hypothetical protein